MFRRFGITSRTQRIALSVIALCLAVAIGLLKEKPDATESVVADQVQSGQTQPSRTQPGQVEPATSEARNADAPRARISSREQAIEQAVRWLKAQEGGRHRGHAIARHVGRSEQDMRARLEREDKNVISGFYDLETAAVAIVRTIRHKPNDERVRRWLDDDASRRRLALRRMFEEPVGRIVYRNGDSRDGKTAVAVLTKSQDGGKAGYRLLTAYVER